MIQTMVQIISPDFECCDWRRGKRIKNDQGEPVQPRLSDYLTVPRIGTFGTFRLIELLPSQTIVELYALHVRLSKNGGKSGKAQHRAR